MYWDCIGKNESSHRTKRPAIKSVQEIIRITQCMQKKDSDIALEPWIDKSQIAKVKCYRVIESSHVVSRKKGSKQKKSNIVWQISFFISLPFQQLCCFSQWHQAAVMEILCQCLHSQVTLCHMATVTSKMSLALQVFSQHCAGQVRLDLSLLHA